MRRRAPVQGFNGTARALWSPTGDMEYPSVPLRFPCITSNGLARRRAGWEVARHKVSKCQALHREPGVRAGWGEHRRARRGRRRSRAQGLARLQSSHLHPRRVRINVAAPLTQSGFHLFAPAFRTPPIRAALFIFLNRSPASVASLLSLCSPDATRKRTPQSRGLTPGEKSPKCCRGSACCCSSLGKGGARTEAAAGL